MDPTTIGLVGFSIALILMALRVPIGFTLAGLAIVCTYLFFGSKYGDEFKCL